MRYVYLFIFLGVLFSCNKKIDVQKKSKTLTKEMRFATQAIEDASTQLKRLINIADIYNQNPRSADSLGTIRWITNRYDWTEGFFSGTLWLAYKNTHDELFKEKAIKFQQLFVSHKNRKNDHDLGFIFNCSYGNGYKLTQKEVYKLILIEAAQSLMQNYYPEVGLILSWDPHQKWVQKRGWKYPVIIDGMMNLELLFEATNYTNDSVYYKAAISHADYTMKHHFRKNNSSYHLVDYSPNKTATVIKKQTHQGAANHSSWARGQAWGLYGFTMCYRYTKDKRYLQQAQKIANFILKHPNLPNDKVPYWDYNVLNLSEAYRDVSAAAITASALLELGGYVINSEYKLSAESILKSIHKSYTNDSYSKSAFILKHSVGNKPSNVEVDVGINYADYYYMEALSRLKKMENNI